jgi:hypothetical protein|tara:strand:- start:14882 stop:15046 length:165 start_codon:yes stop_codon:yes gene_type:complete
MDPNLLVGVVNTALRNDYESLEDLCLTHDISSEELVQRLASGGYEFRSEQQQFR